MSVIIPTYERASLLPEAVASVRRQTVPVHEIVIVDDGSSDGTREVVAGLGPGIRYLHQENQGPSAARNRGLRLAGGELIAFLDSDDLWCDHKLERQTSLLGRYPEAAMVRGRARNVPWSPAEGELAPGTVGPVSWQLGSMLFRRSAFERVGMFEPGLRHWEDIDLVIRIRDAGLLVLEHPDVVVVRRVHERSLSFGVDPDASFVVRVMKQHLDRARRRERPPARAAGDLG